MNILIDLLGLDVIQAIAWTILHSLWQFLIVALGLGLVLASASRLSSSIRHIICLMAMLFSVGLSLNTYYTYIHRPIASVTGMNEHGQTTFYSQFFDYFNEHAPLVILFWFIGFVFFLLRYMSDFLYCQKLKNNNLFAIQDELQAIVHRLLKKTGLTDKVIVFLSSSIHMPCVIGHFKPVILLPLNIVSKIPSDHLAAILLHELAHVRRHDYLVSLTQRFLGVLFFFNPMFRWMSSQADLEREHACDDFAVNHCQNPRIYAESLKEFANMSLHSTVAMAAHNGNQGLLLARIKRLFPHRRQSNLTRSSENFIACLAFIICSAVSIAYADNEPATDTQERPTITEATEEVELKGHTTDNEQASHHDTIMLPDQLVNLDVDEQSGRVIIDMPLMKIDANEKTDEVEIDMPFFKLKATPNGKVSMSLGGNERSLKDFVKSMEDFGQQMQQLNLEQQKDSRRHESLQQHNDVSDSDIQHKIDMVQKQLNALQNTLSSLQEQSPAP